MQIPESAFRAMTNCNFGVCVPQDGKTYGDIRRIAFRCEELGFRSFWLFDHLHSFPRPDKDSFIECWVSLSGLAEATDQIRLGSLVANTQYRNPALLAKMSATVDNISGGRLEFGIGAGGTGRSDWSQRLGFRTEYSAYGMDFPEEAAIRIGRLREAVQIIKKLWMESMASYRGRYYRIEDAFSYPKPLQKPHPPIWIGGAGERFLLKVVAQEADGWNIAWNLSPQEYQKRLDVLSEYCNDFGRPLASIRKSLLTACVTAEDANELRRALREITKPYDEIKGYVPYALRPSALTGTIDECVRKIGGFRDAGVTDFILVFPDFEIDRWLTQFATSVMPSF